MTELEKRVPLEPLDPETSEPGYWIRFHSGVMRMAEAELARRRMSGQLGVAEVVFAWRRALVPVALLAAALASLLLVREAPEPPMSPVALEEALVGELEGGSIPVILGGDVEYAETALLAFGEGF